MKAIVAGVGSPHLSLQEVEAPTPARDEALVGVRAVSLNPGELRMTRHPHSN